MVHSGYLVVVPTIWKMDHILSITVVQKILKSPGPKTREINPVHGIVFDFTHLYFPDF